MNIGITVYPTYGGSGIVGSELGRDLAERGHNVHFISSVLPTRLTELNERIHFHEVEMMSYPLFEHQPYDLALATKMATVARAEKLDLLHVHYAIPHSISAILARESIKQKRYVPVITTLHGTDITLVGADRSYLPITRYGLQQSDGVTAVSKFLKQATIETFDFDEIEVIPNFICPNHYLRLPDSPLRKELAPDGERLLVHVSNFRHVKRPVDCVEILAKVRAAGENAKLILVGDGPEVSAVLYRAEQLAVADNCVFVGKQANISDYLGIADVFLLPSELESFGLAALEAQACEVPVIATRIGGIPEVVNEGESGFLSDVGDVEKMGADTLRLLRDEELRRSFGEKGRELAVQRYSTSKIIPQYIAFYEKIVKKQSRPPRKCQHMLKRYMHKRERHLAMLNDNRSRQTFGWGTEFVVDGVNGDDPRKVLADLSARVIAGSDEYFASPEVEYTLEERLYPSAGSLSAEELKAPVAQVEVPVLSWQSAIETADEQNNIAVATYFPHQDKRSAVIILPHWNAKAGTYFDLAKFFNKVGLSALRLTLPYHEERMPPELERADHLVSPNIGRSLQSIRQAVLDTRAAIRWLKRQGYERVGIVGTSIGSCVAFLAFVHDRDLDAAVFNHVSGYMADVVWHGLSTYHVRDGFADHIGLDELREYWMPVSPMAYMDKLAGQEPRPMRYIYTLYDLSFPVELSRDVIRELRRRKIPHSKATIPCGHYTLGEKPWNYIDGYKIISYLRKHLK